MNKKDRFLDSLTARRASHHGAIFAIPIAIGTGDRRICLGSKVCPEPKSRIWQISEMFGVMIKLPRWRAKIVTSLLPQPSVLVKVQFFSSFRICHKGTILFFLSLSRIYLLKAINQDYSEGTNCQLTDNDFVVRWPFLSFIHLLVRIVIAILQNFLGLNQLLLRK